MLCSPATVTPAIDCTLLARCMQSHCAQLQQQSQLFCGNDSFDYARQRQARTKPLTASDCDPTGGGFQAPVPGQVLCAVRGGRHQAGRADAGARAGDHHRPERCVHRRRVSAREGALGPEPDVIRLSSFALSKWVASLCITMVGITTATCLIAVGLARTHAHKHMSVWAMCSGMHRLQRRSAAAPRWPA